MKTFQFFKATFLTTILVAVSLLVTRVNAQQYGNEWINFSNAYYKFKIATEGAYRISKAQLDAIGMGSVSGNQFAVFREGAEIPIYTSSNGIFGANDFIEFYATKADGKMDTELYPFAEYQPNKKINIISDTAYYFITFDNTTHQRLQLVNNAVPSPAPTPAPYCLYTSSSTIDDRIQWNPGQSHNFNVDHGYFYSSDFDLGEGYAYFFGTNWSTPISTEGLVTTNVPPATLSLSSAGHALANSIVQHALVARVNGTQVFDTAYAGFKMINRSVSFPASLLNSTSSTLQLQDGANFFSSELSVTYPRNYNFAGSLNNKANFQVPATERYLEISGFSSNGQEPRLFDKTNKKLYIGTETGGLVKFYLDPSSSVRDMLLTNVSSIGYINNFKSIQFRNYAISANQGDYIILSHKDYINASPSYVNDFKNYRNSMSGGSHQTVVADVTELYEQFGYGFEFHPIAVKRFAKYALDTWTVKPEFLFIVGKGINYVNYRGYLTTASQYSYSPIPTWGEPGSDNLFTSYNNSQKPVLATGRLSAWNNQEIGDYLEKVKLYEGAIKPAIVPTVASELWKKRALHVAGSTDLNLQQYTLVPTLNDCGNIFRDSMVGGMVITIKKNNTDPMEQGNNELVDSIVNRGLRHLTFYGHASSFGFDYNLNNPDDYNSSPRFMQFNAFGCNVASIFGLTHSKTVSEKYVHSINGGSINMVAGNNTGWTNILTPYMREFYKSFSYKSFGKTLGQQYRDNITRFQDGNVVDGTFLDIHTQCLLYQGDPGVISYNPEHPDYVIETLGLSTIPAEVTTAMDSFTLRAVVYNLGKSIHDSIWVKLQHTKPGMGASLYSDSLRLPKLLFTDTLSFKIPINASRDVGINNYTIKVDAGDERVELSEDNNQATFQLFIYSESLVPVYPKEFAIVHNQDVILKASTLNAFAPLRRYKIEIDTTIQFNSNVKQSTEITSIGGVLKWKPNMVYKDSTVYYWRTSPDTLINGLPNWSNSSFVYLANGSDGWNQSHYYQYRQNLPYTGMNLNEQTGRKFKFSPFVNTYKLENAIVWAHLNNFAQEKESLNDIQLLRFECYAGGALYIAVLDSATGRPWKNSPQGIGGSTPTCFAGLERETFEFPLNTLQGRNNISRFLDSIPNGYYISVRNFIYGNIWNGVDRDVMLNDTIANGDTSLSVYHTLRNMGFTDIDQVVGMKPYMFFTQKGNPNYPVSQMVGPDNQTYITFSVEFNSYPDTGSMKGAIVGPALEWESLKWKTSAIDASPQNDSPAVQIYGIDSLGAETLINTVTNRDYALDAIDANQYPYLRLNWLSVDNITRSSPYLDYWRVHYSPVPEAALNPAAFFEFKDSLLEGERCKLRIAIENLTPYPMDSMLVSFKIIDAGNVKDSIADKRFKKLLGNDTLIADVDFDPAPYLGKNLILIEANPNNDQPEQYHPNNLAYLGMHLKADKLNPLLDVTFDGVHILDKDIVSSKPFVKVLLRDENTILSLSDTSSLKVELLYPNQTTPVSIPMDGTICKFIPSKMEPGAGTKNEARVEFRPTLEEDGLYKLIVSGKDMVGNKAGNAVKYEVQFTVENKPSITNVLNYPNPFSTSTQFIFTMTGSEIPSQFKIQVLTVTGKVVREIKKNELGNLHIGRNITDYRWDGKDEYGQTLGNGVYLYRVITSIRGNDVEQRKNASVDKFFKNGYGKLYIMR